ncbi:hypothetical protein [Spirosoma endophyticum]|uniref:Lipoprotein n=1 Tax=Spirosoma endophyticum TaxID=662367 RepID=A0A1I2IAW4_9BACT|nr:hypothetical protein [Spirosoma endophyticum]SFF38808.1 hypothetical protein SAMN05216167_1617 [Spirosoma endophyticum]
MLKYIGLLTILSVMMACHEPDTPVVQASTSTLRQLVETHYSPKDSITITSTFNEHGQLAQQNFSQQPSQRSYSLYCLYNPTDLTALKDINSQYRYFQSNSNQQLIATKKYFTQYGNYWAVYEADTLLYAQNRLASQVHNDFYFTSDHQGYAFKYPLWVTRRQYKYDNLDRVISEIVLEDI